LGFGKLGLGDLGIHDLHIRPYRYEDRQIVLYFCLSIYISSGKHT